MNKLFPHLSASYSAQPTSFSFCTVGLVRFPTAFARTIAVYGLAVYGLSYWVLHAPILHDERYGDQGRSRIVLVLLALLLSCFLSGCRFGNSLPPTPAPLTLSEPQLNGLESFTVQRGDIVIETSFPGTVTMRRQTELFFAQAGRVKTLAVQSGDFVRADALLAELDVDDLRVQLTEAEWDLEIVRQNHTIAAEEREYNTQLTEQEVKIAELALASLLEEELDKPGSVPPETLAEAEHRLTAAQLDLKRLERTDELTQQKELIAAQVKIQQLQEQIEQSRIVAPFDGNVYFILPTDDMTRLPVEAYAPVLRLVDPTSVAIEASLPDSELERLAEALPATVALDYRPGVAVLGTIERLPFPFGVGGDPFVYITVPEGEQGKLRVGGTVQVNVEIERREDVLWLPPNALRQVGTASYAFLVDGDDERQVEVETGLQTDDQVEITAGLAANDVVVRR
ncbi:MAG: HlyD family efflux transporter periplasmic adaptor subunit [Caldilineaceae bacterium]|nr:HlyD family efflux transporter periplasmic adaptor subunit [Caldilineaceae bacterium]